MKHFTLALLFPGVFLANQVWAQQRTVTGKVSLSDDPEPVPGVAVQIAGTTRGALTNLDGIYQLNLQESDSVLVFSYLGYKTQRVRIGGRAQIDVTLESVPIAREEVVIVGYGTQRKSDVSGSVGATWLL